jgi:P-type Ca2+ transporter type 2C
VPLTAAQSNKSSPVTALHSAVPGRAHLQVAGLYHNAGLKRALEARLADGLNIHGASASPATGNLLVSFEPGVPLRSIVERVEDALRTNVDDADAPPATADPPWHATEIEQTLRALEAPRGGLTSEAARDRRERYGPDALPSIASRTRLAILLDQLQSSPVLLLTGAAALSLASGMRSSFWAWWLSMPV